MLGGQAGVPDMGPKSFRRSQNGSLVMTIRRRRPPSIPLRQRRCLGPDEFSAAGEAVAFRLPPATGWQSAPVPGRLSALLSLRGRIRPRPCSMGSILRSSAMARAARIEKPKRRRIHLQDRLFDATWVEGMPQRRIKEGHSKRTLSDHHQQDVAAPGKESRSTAPQLGRQRR